MTNKIDVGGFYIDSKGKRVQLPCIFNPTINEIEKNYLSYSECEGVICIDNQVNDIHILRLEVLFRHALFFPIIRVDDRAGEVVYTTKGDLNDSDGFVYFNGEPFPKYCAISKKDKLLSIVSEFIGINKISVPSGFVREY